MPVAKCHTLAGLDACADDAVWASPVTSLTSQLSGATVHTPRSRQSEQALLSDTVRFAVDDSNDSLHQFLQRGEADDEAELDWELEPLSGDTPCRALTFCSSPSEPVRRSATCLGGAELAAVQRLASAPTLSPSARRVGNKRSSPGGIGVGVGVGGSVGGRPATPKRPRLQPLADVSNRQASFATDAGSRQSGASLATKPGLHRCVSECGAARRQLDSAKVDTAIASIDSLNLVGDSQQRHSLPTVERLNYGIRHVTCSTVGRLLRGEFGDSAASYQIIDCRYPYEFDGGHIRGAVNIFTQTELLSRVLEPLHQRRSSSSSSNSNTVLIFHCEFSSERAPKLAKFLRQHDRELNSLNYPQLYFPEVYLLQGGYKRFFETHKELCLPLRYTRMADPSFKAELARFQKLSRAWERQNSRSRHSKLERLAQQRLL